MTPESFAAPAPRFTRLYNPQTGKYDILDFGQTFGAACDDALTADMTVEALNAWFASALLTANIVHAAKGINAWNN